MRVKPNNEKKISGGQLPLGQIFRVPNDKLFMLAQMSNLLTPKQKRDLAAAHQMMSDMSFRVTNKQVEKRNRNPFSFYRNSSCYWSS